MYVPLPQEGLFLVGIAEVSPAHLLISSALGLQQVLALNLWYWVQGEGGKDRSTVTELSFRDEGERSGVMP
jgi:hypothetical protein